MNPSIHTLALISSQELRADTQQLARLQMAVIEQSRVMRRLRGEEALRGLLVGMTLHRIKHSLPYGQFGAWAKANITEFGARQVNYLMKLALIFAEKTKVTKPELLALPGDQLDLAVESTDVVQRRFLEKAVKFVGAESLHELLEKHGIKDKGKLGGAREKTVTPAGPIDPEELARLKRDEASDCLARARTLFVEENILQHLAPDEIRAVVDALKALTTDVCAAVKPFLKKASA